VRVADFFGHISVQMVDVRQNEALFPRHSSFAIAETSQDQLAEISSS
jgi:hypothetical protein